jgi:hypothetical protein
MFFKNWPYWLKGGVITIILEAIWGCLQFLTLGAKRGLRIYFSDMNGNFHVEYVYTYVFAVFLFTIALFFVGAIIGWIYGKIKGRKKKMKIG